MRQASTEDNRWSTIAPDPLILPSYARWPCVAPCPANYTITHGREYRYDGGRQRYLNRELDPVELMQGNLVALSDTWTDYDGDEPYGDFTVQSGDPVDARSFQLGLGTVDPWTASDGITTSYYHTDVIGTTRWMTDSSGNAAWSVTYTAFGERVSGDIQRYGYAGAWGYQSHDDFPYLHVGARYYDPSTGRFLQRDPIGIAGGLNVYAYVGNAPTWWVDPLGLLSWRGAGKAVAVGLGGGAAGAAGAAVGSLLGPAGTWFGGIFCASLGGYAAGDAYDYMTDPDNIADLIWDLNHPPPPLRSKPVCVRGCHREPVNY